ncbi:MAG: DoxX family protein [Fermentimonas sp.]|jgi:thiosulfate dehydrogenase [quinone] large subunit
MKHNNINNSNITTIQITGLTILRVMIGWHFLYEGLIKLFTPGWSAKSYLLASTGPLSSFFKSLAESEILMQITDLLNVWGLILIGICLFLGLFTKFSSYIAMVLLALYYISYPPFADFSISGYVDGNYWIVNRNLIEMGALFVLAIFPSGKITGLDRFLIKKNIKRDSLQKKTE